MIRRIFLVVAISASVIAMACGGSSEEDPAASPTLPPPTAVPATATAIPVPACEIAAGLAPTIVESIAGQNFQNPADAPANLRGFIGVWEGAWGGISQSVYVVRSVNPTQAEVIYVFNGAVQGGPPTIPVVDGKLAVTNANATTSISFTWELIGGTVLRGTRVQVNPNSTATVDMKRCSLPRR